MASKYYVWKDPNCNGTNPEWIQMSRKNFLDFIKEPENACRKFIRIPIDPDKRTRGVYVIEATEEEYRKWDALRRREQRKTDILDLPKEKYKKQKCDSCDDDVFCDSEGYENHEEDTTESNADTEKPKSESICVVSMDECFDRREELTLHDVIADESVDVERDVLVRIQLERAYAAAEKVLTKAEKRVLFAMFPRGGDILSEEKTAEKLDCSHQNVSNTLQRIRKKMIQEVAEN